MEHYQVTFAKQVPRLHELLSFSMTTIPHYRNYTGQADDYTRCYDTWLSLPLLQKQMIQEDNMRFLPSAKILEDPDIHAQHTSGSSGVPLNIYRSRREQLYLTKKLWQLRKRFHPGILKWRLLSLYRTVESKHIQALVLGNPEYLDLSEQSLAQYTNEIRAFSPDWLVGPPTAAARLAHFYTDTNQTIPSLKVAELWGEMLFPEQRELIEQALGCKVINHYGCREFDILSFECPHGRLHAWEDDLLFEVLVDGRPAQAGETGQLVVTSLTNMVMPLIRYETGDLVEYRPLETPCPCGNLHAELIPVGGRVANLVITSNQLLTSVIFDTAFARYGRKHQHSIRYFQVRQSKRDQFDVLLVKGKQFIPEHLDTLRKELDRFLYDVHFEYQFVDKIPNQPSGKTPSFIPLTLAKA